MDFNASSYGAGSMDRSTPAFYGASFVPMIGDNLSAPSLTRLHLSDSSKIIPSGLFPTGPGLPLPVAPVPPIAPIASAPIPSSLLQSVNSQYGASSGTSTPVSAAHVTPQQLQSAVTAFFTAGHLQPQLLGSSPSVLGPTTSFKQDAPVAMVPGTLGSPANSLAHSATPNAKILVSYGGHFQKLSNGSNTEYVGGETRLLSVQRSLQVGAFIQQLQKSSPSIMDELVDLVDDDDVQNMWDELADYCRHTGQHTYKLHIYIQQAASSGLATPAHNSLNSQHSDNALPTPPNGGGGRNGSSYNNQAGTHIRNGSAGSRGTIDEETCDDIITFCPRIDLLELEAKLEVIRPDELTVVRLLGAGGYGEVWLSRWHSSEVAVKCLNPSLFVPNGGMGSVGQDVVQELLREASTLGSLRHPNIVWVYGIVLPPAARIKELRERLEPGQAIDAVALAAEMANNMPMTPGLVRPPALVCEYLAGGSLRGALARKADLLRSETVKLKLALDCARGMEYLHAKRIVHFDLKTANLLVGYRDKAPCCKVADFGLSKQKMNTFISGVSSLRGTLPWIAPEIIKTPKAVTEKVDVYSFGVVLWELWTGREPFEGMNYHALLHLMTMEGGLRPPIPGSPEWEGEVIAEPTEGWSALMQRCWQEDVAARPAFTQVIADLEKMLVALKAAKRRVNSV